MLRRNRNVESRAKRSPSFRRKPESSQTIPSYGSRQPQLPFSVISTFRARLHPSIVFSRVKGRLHQPSGFRPSPERRGLRSAFVEWGSSRYLWILGFARRFDCLICLETCARDKACGSWARLCPLDSGFRRNDGGLGAGSSNGRLHDPSGFLVSPGGSIDWGLYT